MKNDSRGMIALTTVLIMGAVVLVLTVSSILISIWEGKSTLALYQGENALRLAENCLEHSLTFAHRSFQYNGGLIVTPEGNCNIVISKAGTTWAITSTNTFGQSTRSVKAIITRTGYGITINSWREI